MHFTGYRLCNVPIISRMKTDTLVAFEFRKGLDAGESAVGERIDVVYRRIVIYSMCVCVWVTHTLCFKRAFEMDTIDSFLLLFF